MKKVFIIHGFMGEPNGGWKPWLMGELYKNDTYACSLPMPDPNNPNKEEWIQTIRDVVNFEEDEIFLVGHSLGVAAILRYLETLPEGQSISGAVLVSGPAFVINPTNPNSKLRKIDNFLDSPYDFDHIKKVCKNFVVIHGDNDSKVVFEHAIKISEGLDCELITVQNGGHLNDRDGVWELPQALEALTKIMN